MVIRGQPSPELPVTSGVPQGSVLGPTLFLAYINDLPKHIDCNISLFADDTLIYQVVNNAPPSNKLQKNIDALHTWATRWGMSFNINKCSVMVFNAKQESPQPQYTLGGALLEVVSSTKYLGVTIQSDLRFNQHIEENVTKAKRQLGMVKRALFDAPESAKLLAYTSLCRPHVEYAAAVWDPHLAYHISNIEKLQNAAVRFIACIKGRESVSTAREKLKLEPLAARRHGTRHKLLMRLLAKEENHESLMSTYDDLMNSREETKITTRAVSQHQPPTIYAKTSTYHTSFLPKTVRELKSKLFTDC